MIRYETYLNKNVRVITMILFRSGRKINTTYFGVVDSIKGHQIILIEKDGQKVYISKKHIKRIEEIK